MIKLKLEKPKNTNTDDRYKFYAWNSCAPFVENKRAVLIHRPRTVQTIKTSLKCISPIPYLAVHHWCGGTAVGNDGITFLDVLPDEAIVCARCETIALMRGLPKSSEIVGRHVHIGGVKAIKFCCDEEN